MSNRKSGRRITLKSNRPNPIFEYWLRGLHEEAKEKESKLEPMLKVALESLLRFPLPLQSGADCACLIGFDEKLCRFLDIRLKAYYSSTSGSKVSSKVKASSQTSKGSPKSSTSTANINRTRNTTANRPSNSLSAHSLKNANAKQRTPKIFKPKFRSGSYAILMALLEHSRTYPPAPPLDKEDIIALAQQHCEESFSKAKPGCFYTAWSSMKTLLRHKLVSCVRCERTIYIFSADGYSLALDLFREYKNKPTINDVIFNGAPTSNLHTMGNLDNLMPCGSSTSSQTVTPVLSQISSSDSVFIEMPADSFEVILVIDKNETSGVSKKNDPTVAQFKNYPNLKHEYRSLKVGDFTWIARHKANEDHELVLPYIVERKRMDDFGASIKDGRFHEQKFRLRKCGLNNVIYLVENYGSNKHVGLPFQSLMQALANTRVQDEFKVHVTDSLNNSVRFLAMITKRLTIEYKDKHLIGRNQESQGEELMTFDYFNKASSKNKPLCVTEMFLKLLLQLKGVSVEKALSITKVYSTPKSLITEYEKYTQKEGEILLANLKYGPQNRNVGPKLSKSIYRFLVWME